MIKQALRDHFLTTCDDEQLRQWFDPLAIAMDNNARCLQITFPHPFFAKWFQSGIQGQFEELLMTFLEEGYVFDYVTCQTQPSEPQQPNEPPFHSAQPDNFPFGRQFVFDTFFYNKKNMFPVASAQEIARSGGPKYNPFVLCGPSGSGKTHLVRAIANDLARAYSKSSIFMGSMEEFAFVYAEQFKGDVYAARRFFTGHQFIFIDDLQRLKDFQELQEELVVLFNMFHDQERQMVFSCTGTLSEMGFIDPKLKSRLEWGLIAQLKSQDLDVRVRFVQQQVSKRKIRLNKEQIFMLCQRFPDFRNLQGVLTKLSAYRDLMNREVTERDFEQILAHSDNTQGTTLTSEIILDIVSEHFSLSAKDLTGTKRHQKIVLARQTAMFLCRKLLGSSYPSLGRIFGGKDHSTAMYAVKKIQQLQESNSDTKLLVTELKKKCLAQNK